MSIVKGVVKAVSKKERDTKWGKKLTTSFNVEDEWYSGGFKSWPAQKGDEVQINYDDSSPYKNIKSMEVVSSSLAAVDSTKSSSTGGKFMSGRSFPVDALAPERTINRQNALTNAVSYMKLLPAEEVGAISVFNVIEVARHFEAYTTGDIDREEAMAMLDD